MNQTTVEPQTAIDRYTEATLDKRDAERRIDENRADAMGEVFTLTLAGKKAVSHDRVLLIVKGTETLDVHGTLKLIAKEMGFPDLREHSAVEALLGTMAGTALVKLQYKKSVDSLRVI